jgi:hypothetical protein
MAAVLKPHQFQLGNPGGGRPLGARNKLTETFLQALARDFSTHGEAAIAKVREERPHHYLSVIAGLMPRQQQVIESPLSNLSDAELEQLEKHLTALRARLVREIEG